MSHLVVFEAGHQRILAIEHSGSWREMLSDAVERVGFESFSRAQIGLGILHEIGELRFVESFDARG